MPRPPEGYRNAAGEQVPGVGDPVSRYKDSSALMFWAFKRGKDGFDRLYDQTALDIGSCVHRMCELDLRGQTDRAIEKCAHDYLAAPDHLQKAWNSFRQFRQWRESCHVRAISLEKSLISEMHQCGTTIDTIAMFGNAGLGLLEFKTSKTVYPDHLIEMAARAKLWEENFPDQPLTAGCHLIILPKDGGEFQHHSYDDLSVQWEMFKLYLAAYKLEKGLKPAKKAKAVKTIVAAPKAKLAKPRIRVNAATSLAAVNAMILQAYNKEKRA